MAWIGAAIGAVGGLLGGGMANSAASGANAWARDSAEENYNYQTEMSNSAYQRQVQDLKKAGLNPMLGMMKGSSGASTPSGGQAVTHDPSSAIGSAVTAGSNVMESAVKLATVQRTKAETDLAKVNTAKVAEETELIKSQVPKTQAETATEKERTANVAVHTEKMISEIKKVVADTDLSRAQEVHVMQQAENAVYDQDLTKIHTGNAVLDSKLKEITAEYLRLGLPREKNLSDVQGDWWFKTVSPYLPDVLKTTGTGASVLRLGK